jgi:GNAT superfamily N-acetyltransferase
MSASIRRARPEEAEILTEIAHAAKRHWGYPERWIALWRDALTFTPSFIAQHPVYVATASERPIGCYAFGREGSTATLEHLWVHPEFMGRGVGRCLLEYAVRSATELGADVLQIDSDPHAEAFYVRMGAKRVGKVPADVDGHQRMLPRLILALNAAQQADAGDEGPGMISE